MRSQSFTAVAVLVLSSRVYAQCNTDQNPYCAGNNQFEQLCCPYPNVCYWADRQGTPACCPAGTVCHDYEGITVKPQPIYTTIKPTTVVPVQPTTVYSTVVPVPPPTTVIVTSIQPSPCCHTVTEVQPQPTQGALPTITITTQGVVEGIGSTIVAAGSSVINVFQGAAPTARPSQCAVPVVGAVAIAAAWHFG
ncbi:uncharacterized protein AB675_4174 [Cyphellophora attinorum]|uniref:GPI anchored serine-threonine rich protein n=1 Tax=Cyphellophora attinorum TaxID=1664694 RepID=A0A0N1HMJ5_9EURO|nr:uncharacterized protein AB675_4174 [Phialophora attinorum]KPI38514.1 hypothetical protein AB675_4174 [Phialophora attinorum]